MKETLNCEEYTRHTIYYNNDGAYFRNFFKEWTNSDQPLQGITIDWETDLVKPETRTIDLRLQELAFPNLEALDILDKADPLFMVSSERLSLKQRNISEAFKRRMERRLQTIKARGNFFEIYRNRDLFEKDEFNDLLKLSLAKADNSELPPEFRDYAIFL